MLLVRFAPLPAWILVDLVAPSCIFGIWYLAECRLSINTTKMSFESPVFDKSTANTMTFKHRCQSLHEFANPFCLFSPSEILAQLWVNKMAAPAARFQRRVLESPSHELLQALVDLEPPVSWNTVSKHCLPLPGKKTLDKFRKWNLMEGMETVDVG